MAGRIPEEDIAQVREKARIDDVVSAYVTLRKAGGGSFKGLCPFHDEKSPSFHVTPARGFFHCFGCQEGGDVISFLMRIDGLGFSEAVEHLAEKYGVQLRREDGHEPQRPRGPHRSRLIEAHTAAQEFYAEQLVSPEAIVARRFLAGRGFDQAAAEQFGVGYAPRDGEALTRLLRQRGFSEEEAVTAGLVAVGRSAYDRFRGRLLWPIRESNGDTIGFGARRIHDDDRIEAKYLNTPETPIYKKSKVLYGLDLARREIDRTSQAVVVEGYTDVMACHLAGVGTAVATCGTAFGDEHARVLRRFLGDHSGSRGEVIFTFDGDAAGQKAALRAFENDQNFVSQTYVAVEPSGLDPCDLRLREGDEAVRELVAGRTPLYRFVLTNIVHQFDLDRADGRVDALREAATLVGSVRDRSKVEAFTRELASMVGVDVDDARTEVRRAVGRTARSGGPAPLGATRPASPEGPDPRDPRFAIERETLKVLLQVPQAAGRGLDGVVADDFVHPLYRGVWEAIQTAGGVRAGASGPGWAARVRDVSATPMVAAMVSALGVEGLRAGRPPDEAYANAHLYRLQELTAMRRIADLKSRLQRTDPAAEGSDYQRMFSELVSLEQHRRDLRGRAVGS